MKDGGLRGLIEARSDQMHMEADDSGTFGISYLCFETVLM